jgi:PKHD-type hydroxylase
MMIHIRNALSSEQVSHCRRVLQSVGWVDGRVTAGAQSGRTKRNLQAPEDAPEAAALGELILNALAASPHFMSAALPLKVFPPLFNRYGEGMGFGDHIDNAIRVSPLSEARYRTDLSCTLFLTDPDDYDGGELVVGEDLSAVRVKLPAGDLVLYPATTIHRVEPVTSGFSPWSPTRASAPCSTSWTAPPARPASGSATTPPPRSRWSASTTTSCACGPRSDHSGRPGTRIGLPLIGARTPRISAGSRRRNGGASRSKSAEDEPCSKLYAPSQRPAPSPDSRPGS